MPGLVNDTLLDELIDRQEKERLEHERALGEHQGHHEDRWRPAGKHQVWRPDFEDFEE